MPKPTLNIAAGAADDGTETLTLTMRAKDLAACRAKFNASRLPKKAASFEAAAAILVRRGFKRCGADARYIIIDIAQCRGETARALIEMAPAGTLRIQDLR